MFKGESPFGKFKLRKWQILMSNSFFSISVWRKWNLDYLYLKIYMFCLIADLNSLNLVLINADIELIKSSFRGDLVPFFVYIDCPCFHWGGGRGGGVGRGGFSRGSHVHARRDWHPVYFEMDWVRYCEGEFANHNKKCWKFKISLIWNMAYEFSMILSFSSILLKVVCRVQIW